MYKLWISMLMLVIATSGVQAKTLTMKNKYNQTTGYVKTTSEGKVREYDKYGTLKYTYKKNAGGGYAKYSRDGIKLEVLN